jgi:hypothetical protein
LEERKTFFRFAFQVSSKTTKGLKVIEKPFIGMVSFHTPPKAKES